MRSSGYVRCSISKAVSRRSWSTIRLPRCSVLTAGLMVAKTCATVYIDDLLTLLSKAGFGCYIGPVFVGALVYADDIVLLAPTPTALRTMLAICENSAVDFCIRFNSLKTKCSVFMPTCRRIMNEQFKSGAFYL
jgi:hypothetical protein